ncbi:4Fe-4S binding protein [Anaeromicrobium sediminis]|uniref:4Fe-4S ferredoxin n=1 Tax=Anaeromicrobium sediminis TaxID=1478221 RepID=A0A267MCY0_9FIRM|nr:4Fe-4S binding protein [Anaeromicrobium sediminis]PAB57409.1 4Fe-4S ferredoxin [Anaeromicrobium sediminis]
MRKAVQIIWTIITNGYVPGFIKGTIYRGATKKFCVPGLNCYSCPGALGSCPIGSLQAVIGSIKYSISYYVLGFLFLIGTIGGRFVCGWLCPFGLIQELLYKFPSKKRVLYDKLKYIKYGVLIIFVILMPMLFTNKLGMGNPAFCKYICPAGTLEGGIPLLITNPALRKSIGLLFTLKFSILIITLVSSIIYFRPFCKVLCPLGAIYSLFNSISFYRLEVDSNECISCGLCSKACKMNVVPCKNPNALECIRCNDCMDICPTDAITCNMNIPNKKKGVFNNE